MKLYLYSLLIITTPLCAKRHSRMNKIERYEQRAKAAAEAHSPLAAALSKQTARMNFEEAVVAQEYYRGTKESDMIIKCGERILAVGGDQEVLRKTRLELAEVSLEKRKFDEALKHAKDYLTFYPGSQESKKASFVGLSATYKSQSNSYRDQGKTRETIDRAEAFLKKHSRDATYAAPAKQMLSTSYLKLIRSEINIISTQLHTFNYANSTASLIAAQNRIKYLKEHYLPHAPEARKRVLELEITLAQAAQDKELIKTKQQELKALATKKPLKLAENITLPRQYWNSTKEFFIEDNQKFFA